MILKSVKLIDKTNKVLSISYEKIGIFKNTLVKDKLVFYTRYSWEFLDGTERLDSGLYKLDDQLTRLFNMMQPGDLIKPGEEFNL